MKKDFINRLMASFSLLLFFLAVNSAPAFELDFNKIIDLGKSGMKAGQDFTEEEQYYVGRSAGASILSSNSLSPSKELQSYISSIGQTLALASSRPETFKGYHFILLDEPDKVNAYAVPGGFIFVTTGLINKAESEDEIAGIIAHEVAHIVLHHPSDSIKKVYKDKFAKSLLSFASGQIAGNDADLANLVDGLNELSGMLIDSAAKGYSRGKEKDADMEGVDIMLKAGYNPNALAKILSKLSPVGSGSSGTHGDPIKRKNNVLKKIKKIGLTPVDSSPRVARYGIYFSQTN